MIRFAISDRKLHPGDDAAQQASIVAQAARLSAAGVDFFQVREKDLNPDELASLVRQIVTRARSHGPMRVLVNSNIAVAQQAEAHGIHFTSSDLRDRQQQITHAVAAGFVVTASCHTLSEIELARDLNLTAALFSPVFGKTVRGEDVQPALGLGALREALHQAGNLPVIALGGITEKTQQACMEAGAAGVAGIRMFL